MSMVHVINYLQGAEIDFSRDVFLTPDGSEYDVARIVYWGLAGSAPNQATVDATVADGTFQTYVAEHGGDESLTARRVAKAFVTSTDPTDIAIKSILLVARDEINALRSTLLLSPLTKNYWLNATIAKIESGDAG